MVNAMLMAAVMGVMGKAPVAAATELYRGNSNSDGVNKYQEQQHLKTTLFIEEALFHEGTNMIKVSAYSHLSSRGTEKKNPLGSL